MLYKYTTQAGEQALQWSKAGKEVFFYFAKYILIVTLTLLTDVLERECILLVEGNQEIYLDFFSWKFYRAIRIINYYSFTWYVSAGVLFFPSQYFMQFSRGLRKLSNMRRHESEGKPV